MIPRQFESLNAELEQNQELANSRMAELEKLQLELQEAVRESEKLKVKLGIHDTQRQPVEG